MITGSAALNAARAALRSPLWIASSTLRTEFRSTERRALLISVRRAITRVAFRADFVLAINLSFAAGASSGPSAKATRFYKKLRRRSKSPARLRLIVRPCLRVNARTGLHATRFARTASCPETTAARSAAENGASGGLTRARPGSPWI